MSADTWCRVCRPRPDNWGYTRRCCYVQVGAWPGGAHGPGRAAAVVGEVICPTSGRGRAPAMLKIQGVVPTFVLAREGGFGLSTVVETVPSRYRATVASHYCELSHCGVTAAAYAADSVFSARYSRAGPHDPPPARCSVPGPFKDGDRLSGKSSIKRLSGS
jgi:hypothetical protein